MSNDLSSSAEKNLIKSADSSGSLASSLSSNTRPFSGQSFRDNEISKDSQSVAAATNINQPPCRPLSSSGGGNSPIAVSSGFASKAHSASLSHGNLNASAETAANFPSETQRPQDTPSSDEELDRLEVILENKLQQQTLRLEKHFDAKFSALEKILSDKLNYFDETMKGHLTQITNLSDIISSNVSLNRQSGHSAVNSPTPTISATQSSTSSPSPNHSPKQYQKHSKHRYSGESYPSISPIEENARKGTSNLALYSQSMADMATSSHNVSYS